MQLVKGLSCQKKKRQEGRDDFCQVSSECTQENERISSVFSFGGSATKTSVLKVSGQSIHLRCLVQFENLYTEN